MKRDKVLMAALLMGSQEGPIILSNAHIREEHLQKIYKNCPKSDCKQTKWCSLAGHCKFSTWYIREQWDILRQDLGNLIEKIEGKHHLTPAEILNSYDLYRPIFLGWIQKDQAALLDQSITNITARLKSKAYRKTISANSVKRQNFIMFFQDIPAEIRDRQNQTFWKKIRQEFGF